jgi:hypothetical protein
MYAARERLKGITNKFGALQALAVFFLAAHVTMSGRCQDKVLAVIQASREVGVSLIFSHIAHDEYTAGAVLDSEHGWISGVGVKVSGLLNALKVTDILVGAAYGFLLTPKLLLTGEGKAQYREWLRQLSAAAYDTRENYTFWLAELQWVLATIR